VGGFLSGAVGVRNGSTPFLSKLWARFFFDFSPPSSTAVLASGFLVYLDFFLHLPFFLFPTHLLPPFETGFRTSNVAGQMTKPP